MSERPLLLSSARTAVIVPKAPSPWLRRGAVVLGIVAILIGAADALDRLSKLSFERGVLFTAFAPAAALNNPSALDALSGFVEATSTTPLVPAVLRVPSLEIEGAVEQVGRKPNGEMATPSSFSTIAWYAPGAKPGASGNAVFAGHLNNALGLAGVFERLGEVRLGAVIEVEGAEGRTLSYIVTKIEEYPADDTTSLEAIFTTEGPSQMVLITCEGEWDQSSRSFDKRLVVVARLIVL